MDDDISQAPRTSSMVGVVLVMGFAVLLIATGIAFAQHQVPPPRIHDLTFSPDECVEGRDEAWQEGAPPCRDPFTEHLQELRPGDVLTIAPGTYDVGTVTVYDIRGEPDDRILVTALDPDDPPEITGALRIFGAEHVTFSHLDLVGGQTKLPAIGIQCGVGWELRESTVRGASDTGAVSNLSISGYQEPPPPPQNPETCPDEPRDFVVEDNCFRDPHTNPALQDHPDEAIRRTRGFYHQIYVSFEGSDATGGRIEGNRFEGHLNGAGIKLGNGATHERGPRNVVVARNAFLTGRNMVILSEDIRDNRIEGNIAIDVEGPTNAGGDVAVYGAGLREDTNVVADNRLWGARTIVGLAPDSAEIRDGGGNVLVGEEDDDLDRDLPRAADGCVEASALPWDP